MKEKIKDITKWIKEYVLASGAKGVVIGNSGGKDSATVIGLAAMALGKENVLAVAMPCNSIEEDLADGKLVVETFGVNNLLIDIKNVYDELEQVIEKTGIKLNADAKINIKPRLRMTTLYSIAQTYNYLVIGTGNLCESFVGYTTKWGDSASDFNPIANFTVDEVLEIAKEVGVPEKIMKKAPNDGLGGKSDEEKLGISYKEITSYIKTGKTNEYAMKKIKELHRKSEHKRNPIPTYEP